MMQSSQLSLLEIVEGIGLCETDVVQRQSSILFRPLCCCFACCEQSVGLRHCTTLYSVETMYARVIRDVYCTTMGYEAKVKR